MSQPTITFVQVSDELFENLQKRFDDGEEQVFTGRSDGTNRRVFRNEQKGIYSEDGKMVVPFSVVQGWGGQKIFINPCQKAMHENFDMKKKYKWLYCSKTGKVVGAIQDTKVVCDGNVDFDDVIVEP